MEASESSRHFAFVIPLKTAAWNYVENAVSTVAIFGGIASALHFQIIDIFGVELNTDITRDAGIRHGNAINHPGNLMPATDVKHIVGHVCARNKASNHSQTVALIGARCFVHVATRYRRRGRERLGAHGAGALRYLDRLARAGERELKVHQRRAAGTNQNGLFRRSKSFTSNRKLILANRHRHKLKFAIRVGAGCWLIFRRCRL